MQLIPLLHKSFQKQLPFVHKTRFQTLMDVCSTAIVSNKLYLTGLGRELRNHNKVSSNIQKVDRLLGNSHLHNERISFYQVMIQHLIKPQTQPWIHIDWTCINAKTSLYVLRASLSLSGRSIVIYEECHPKNKENNNAIHKTFLNQLKALIPLDVKPIIITDAGFRAPWFEQVLQLGWDFVGRLRNKNLVRLNGSSSWQLTSSLFENAQNKPTHVGDCILTRERQIVGHLVLYKGKR